MREFYIQCMNDLFALTGLEQMRWLKMDLKDGERTFDLCVEAMVQTSKLFPYISEVDQQKIIKKMMVEDKDYTGLNSRTIYKWLNMHKGVYWVNQSDYQEITREPAPPEVADKYLEEWKREVAKIGKVTTPAPLNQLHRDVGNTVVTGKEYVKYLASQTLFICDGVEIHAGSEEDAKKYYRQAFEKDPEKVSMENPETSAEN